MCACPSRFSIPPRSADASRPTAKGGKNGVPDAKQARLTAFFDHGGKNSSGEVDNCVATNTMTSGTAIHRAGTGCAADKTRARKAGGEKKARETRRYLKKEEQPQGFVAPSSDNNHDQVERRIPVRGVML